VGDDLLLIYYLCSSSSNIVTTNSRTSQLTPHLSETYVAITELRHKQLQPTPLSRHPNAIRTSHIYLLRPIAYIATVMRGARRMLSKNRSFEVCREW